MVIIPGKGKNLARRYYAGVIDYVALLVLVIIYVRIAGVPAGEVSYAVFGWQALGVPSLWFLYFPVCEGVFGQTLAKKAFNLYVVDLNGMQPHVGQAFIRRVFDLLDIATMGISGLLLINYTPTNQRLGDLLAETTVIRTDAVCRHCGATLELSPREVVRNVFDCPVCNAVN
jgi:uncharacterized RDD family membrane protein YckC